MIELQDILALHGDDYLQSHQLSPEQRKAYYAILNCRTSTLGAHVDTCDHCGFEKISYNSCRNRHCPKCQTVAKEQWIEKQEQSLLNIGYFHVVFTVPDDLNPVFYQNQKVMYNLLFKAASETLQELGRNDKYLGAQLGITAILHTWGQNLLYHPHLHCVVTGGGLTKQSEWRNSRKKFFIPVKVLSKLFRGKFLFYLRQAQLNFATSIAELSIPSQFDLFISNLYGKPWVTYCKPPFENASKVMDYLGRYTHRVAISNNRITNLADGRVTFSWRDYKDNNKLKQMTVSAIEFIRRFLLHVLPSGFRKIRHFGLLASRNKFAKIALCKKLTNTLIRTPTPVLSKAIDILRKVFGDTFNLCPRCGVGHFSRASPELVF